MLHVLIGTNDADYDAIQSAASGAKPLPEWVVPKNAVRGDTVVFFVPAHGFVATGAVARRLEKKSNFGERVAYRARVRDVKMLVAPVGLDQVAATIPEWAWTRYPRTFTTPNPQVAERLLELLSNGNAKRKGAFLFGWKPEQKQPASIADSVAELCSIGTTTRNWRSGRRQNLPVNSRAYMIRLGRGPCGIIGAGWTRTEPNEEPSVDIEFEILSETPLITMDALQAEAPFSKVHWTPQGSGVNLPADVVEALDARLKSFVPTVDREEYENLADQLLEQGPLVPPEGVLHPQPILTTSKVYPRSPAIRAHVLQRAKGRCELCGNSAPFKRSNGQPYLESHHIIQLADGGSDTRGNTAAVCPNCHRSLHCSADRDSLRTRLGDIVAELEK